MANDDHKDTLSEVVIYSKSRPLDWTVEDPKKDYTLFEAFSDEMIEKLELEPLAYHSHTWVIKTDTYEERDQLTEFFDVLATDEFEGEEFVVAVEGKHYPVTGVMFHPETQNRRVVGTSYNTQGSLKGKINDERTDTINYYFSEHVRRRGLQNMDTHKFADKEFGMRMEWMNADYGLTRGGIGQFLPSSGFD